MINLIILAIASLATISILGYVIWRLAKVIKALDRVILQERSWHYREINAMRTRLFSEKKEYLLKTEREFLGKLRMLEELKADKFLMPEGMEIPVFHVPVRYSEEISSHFYNHSMPMPSARMPETKRFEAKKMEFSYLEEGLDQRIIKANIANELARWMLKNNFVFGKFDRDRGVITFGFYYYAP
jgi:hypothetical protein